jgi:hypothetical protein
MRSMQRGRWCRDFATEDQRERWGVTDFCVGVWYCEMEGLRRKKTGVSCYCFCCSHSESLKVTDDDCGDDV